MSYHVERGLRAGRQFSDNFFSWPRPETHPEVRRRRLRRQKRDEHLLPIGRVHRQRLDHLRKGAFEFS